MQWSDRIRDFVGFAVAGCAYRLWLHRQERKHSTTKNSESAMRNSAETNAQLLGAAKAMEQADMRRA